MIDYGNNYREKVEPFTGNKMRIQKFLFILCAIPLCQSCALQKHADWVRLCEATHVEPVKAKPIMVADDDGNIYIQHHRLFKALMYDAAIKSLKVTDWPTEMYSRIEVRAQKHNDPKIAYDTLRGYIQAGLYDGMTRAVGLESMVQKIDKAESDRDLGLFKKEENYARSGPRAKILTDDKRLNTTSLLHDLADGLSSPNPCWVLHDNVYYGMIYIDEDESHDFYGSGNYWPRVLLDALNKSDSGPTLCFCGIVRGYRFNISHIYTFDYFKDGGFHNPEFFWHGNNHPFLIRDEVIWIQIPNGSWRKWGIVPVHSGSERFVTPSYCVDTNYLYVYGQSLQTGRPTIAKLPLNKL